MTVYVDGILADLLRAAAVVPASGGDSRVYTRQLADLADRLPCIVVRGVAGGTAYQAVPDGARNIPWQLDVFTADTGDAGRACHAIARAAVRALSSAAHRGGGGADGALNAITSIVGPVDVSTLGDVPSGVMHWRVTGLAAARKPF